MQRKFTQVKNNREKIPNHIKRWFAKPRDFEGSAAVIARPGTLVPRVHRDAKVVCKVIWVSDTYFDDNGRSRKDVAFELCEGTIDGVIRIEAGEDRIPIYNYLGIDDVVTGQQFYKSLEIKLGAFDQTQSLIIKNREGDDNTPYFRGLAYFVLKGFKLWKWPNRSIPYMEAVVLRNIEEATEDTYADDPTFYNPPAAYPVTSIAGDPDANPLEYLYVTYSGGNIFQVELSTNTWTNIGTNVGGTNIKTFNALGWRGGTLYVANYRGLYEWQGGTTWTQIFTNGTNVGGNVSVTSNSNVIYFQSNDPIIRFYSYDGNSVNNEGTAPFPNCAATGLAELPSNLGFLRMVYSGSNETIRTDNGDLSYTAISDIQNSKGVLVDPTTGYLVWPTYSSNDLIMRRQEFTAEPAAPGAGDSVTVFSDTVVSRPSDIERFSNRWHLTRSVIGGTNALYRVENDDSITTMPSPSAASAYYTHMIQRIGTRLFVGSSRGFWEAGDA